MAVAPKASGWISLCEAGCLAGAMGDYAVCAGSFYVCCPVCEEGVYTQCVDEMNACCDEALDGQITCEIGCNFGGAGGTWIAAPTGASPRVYEPGQPLQLEAARFDENMQMLQDQGAVQEANFYLYDLGYVEGQPPEFDESPEFPWVPIGSGVFNGMNTWTVDLDMSEFEAPTGYLVRMDFIDPTLTSGVSIGLSALVPSPAVTPAVPTMRQPGYGLLAIILLLLGAGASAVLVRRPRFRARALR